MDGFKQRTSHNFVYLIGHFRNPISGKFFLNKMVEAKGVISGAKYSWKLKKDESWKLIIWLVPSLLAKFSMLQKLWMFASPVREEWPCP